MRILRRLAGAGVMVLVLAGCSLQQGLLATVGPDYEPRAATAPAQWQAPLPHGGDVAELQSWWRQFDDPALAQLIASSETGNATLAQAASRIAQARASAVAAGASGVPTFDALANASRAAFTFGGPALIRNQVQVGVQSSWEIDLFGGLARRREAAEATLAASGYAWHDARVSLAAEVANAYVNYRYCELQRRIAETEAASRAETAGITEVAAKAGFQPEAAAALTKATAADAANALVQRRTQCEVAVKTLVSLSAMDEPAVRALLAKGTARLPEPKRFEVEAIPARVVAQRPDVRQAERELAAASAQVGVQAATRYPSLAISGNVLPTRMRINGGPTLSLTTWSIGPTLTIPVYDAGGRQAAAIDAARVQFEALDTVFRARVRNAVREVEEALVRLEGAEERGAESEKSAAGFRTNLEAVEARYKAGFASRLDVLEAERTALSAQIGVAAWRQERLAAWIALYRAVGGGWDAAQGEEQKP